MKIAAIFFLVCSAPMAAVAQQEQDRSALSQATAGQSTPPPKTMESQGKPATAIDPTKEAAIRKLFDVLGIRDSMRQIIAGMSGTVRPTLEASLPPGEYRAKLIDLFFEKFQSKFNVDKMLEVSIPIYDKYFSIEDIEGLTKFYQTPLGKKAAAVLPQVFLEAQDSGRKFGEQIGRESMQEVLDEHPDLRKALEDAAAATKN